MITINPAVYISGPMESADVSTGGAGGGLFVVVAVLLHADIKPKRISEMAKAL